MSDNISNQYQDYFRLQPQLQLVNNYLLYAVFILKLKLLKYFFLIKHQKLYFTKTHLTHHDDVTFAHDPHFYWTALEHITVWLSLTLRPKQRKQTKSLIKFTGSFSLMLIVSVVMRGELTATSPNSLNSSAACDCVRTFG